MRWSAQSIVFPYIISRKEIREGKRLGPILKAVIDTQARPGGVRGAGCTIEETRTQRCSDHLRVPFWFNRRKYSRLTSQLLSSSEPSIGRYSSPSEMAAVGYTETIRNKTIV